MDLIRSTRQYMEVHRMLRPGEPVMVGVSGGVDSMVLLNVLRELGYPCHVVHVDHGLRGKESDADREFVLQFCRERQIPCTVMTGDVGAIAAEHGLSRAMAARDLRLRSFLKVMQQQGVSNLALAHHGDDAVETLFIRLMQGMGVDGWRTIAPVSHHRQPHPALPAQPEGAWQVRFVRPLLHADREDVLLHARERGLPWRSDASNQDRRQLRNRIRLDLLPLLQQWWPGSGEVLQRNTHLLREMHALADERLRRDVERCAGNAPGKGFSLPVEEVLHHPAPELFLRSLTRHLHLHHARYGEILQVLREGEGPAQFHTAHGRLWVHAGQVHVLPPASAQDGPWNFSDVRRPPPGMPMRLEWVAAEQVEGPFVPHVAWFDADALSPPFVLRAWRHGDRMHPLGMHGSKLVSDILTDRKITGPGKKDVHVLVAGGRIVWVCGVRLAEGVQARPASRTVLRAEWQGAVPHR